MTINHAHSTRFKRQTLLRDMLARVIVSQFGHLGHSNEPQAVKDARDLLDTTAAAEPAEPVESTDIETRVAIALMERTLICG